MFNLNLLLFAIGLSACHQKSENSKPDLIKSIEKPEKTLPELAQKDSTIADCIYLHSEIEQKLKSSGLINLLDLDSSFKVDLRYSSENNFMKKDVYGSLNHAYLQPDVAEKLLLAQYFLKLKYPKYHLLIYDAVRPMSIQKKMWETLDMPAKEKTKYISNPQNGGSLHNYGAAVDLSIADANGDELDMGTPFDHFEELAYPRKEQEMLAAGKLRKDQVDNRKLLREVMSKAGFFNIQTEWWHFNSCTRAEAQAKYQLIE